MVKSRFTKLKVYIDDKDMLFQEEWSVSGYLGVHIDQFYDISIHLTQNVLIQKKIEAMNLSGDSIKPIDTPCNSYWPINEYPNKDNGDFK